MSIQFNFAGIYIDIYRVNIMYVPNLVLQTIEAMRIFEKL